MNTLRWLLMIVVLVGLLAAAAVVGPGGYGLADVLDAFWGGVVGDSSMDSTKRAILWELRIPRRKSSWAACQLADTPAYTRPRKKKESLP